MRMLAELPQKEQEYIKRHVKAIPRDWDPRTLPKLFVPEQLPWAQQYEQNKNLSYDKPIPLKYVTFEWMLLSYGEDPYTTVRRALVANGEIIVEYLWEN